MADTILYDTAMRLFGDLVSPALIDRAQGGEFPAALWDAVAAAGFADVLADGPSGMVEAVIILRAAGHHAAPIPLPETMLARWLCRAAGLEPPAGILTVAPVEPGERALRIGDTLAGRAGQVPWGGVAAAIVVVAEGRVHIAPRPANPDTVGHVEPGSNLAGEPRDRLIAALDGPSAPLPEAIDGEALLRLGALLRAAQMAGAMAGALDLSVRYANDRVQFGRPLAKFQAIQHQLALLAEAAAASQVAVDSAAQAVASGLQSAPFAIMAAKIRAGEAAGRVTDIAHQVHGAIGFTAEYPLHHLTRRLWSWRDEFGSEAHWSLALGRQIAQEGADRLWPMITTGITTGITAGITAG